jgi:methylated-DNA-[protein]-cysteine S-methyltransferase
MNAITQTIATPDGPFTIVAVDGDAGEQVISSGWTASLDDALARLPEALLPQSVTVGALTASEAVEAYYAGDVTAIDAVPVRHSGGPFRTIAWGALRSIQAGHPLTYSQFAETIGSPRAVRAAASACATNAPALFVPCHRVLRTDGTLGGFAWGLAVKRSLLDREAAAAQS